MKLNRASEPIVYRRIRSSVELESAYSHQFERFVREERSRVAQRRAWTFVAVGLVIVFAIFVGGAK